MFSNEIREQIFAHEDMYKIPIETQSTAVHVFERVLKDRLEENPYASVSELFVSTATDESVSEF